MAKIGLGGPEVAYASRPLTGNAQYMPDATTVLNHNGGTSSDAWGTAMLAGLAAGEGFLVASNQDFTVQFVGNTGNGVIQVFDPIVNDWVTIIIIDDAVAHVIRAPLLTFRIGMVTHAGASAVKLTYHRQSGTP